MAIICSYFTTLALFKYYKMLKKTAPCIVKEEQVLKN